MKSICLALGAALLSAVASSALADSATWTQQVITPEIALKAAQAARAECQKRGWQVAVTVADPAGLALVMLRDPLCRLAHGGGGQRQGAHRGKLARGDQ